MERRRKIVATSGSKSVEKKSIDFSVVNGWRDVSDAMPGSPMSGTRLLAHITICGCSMHLEAYQVVRKGGVQVPKDPEFEGVVADIYEAAGGSGGSWEEVTIGRRRYVLVATPFC